MDLHLQSPCNICASINRNSSLRRRFPSPNTVKFPSKSRLKPTSELQTPVVAAVTPHTISPSVPTHKVTVHDRQRDVVHEFYVPEDQYILHTGESQDIALPFACRQRGLSMGLHYFPLLGDDEVITLEGLQEKNHLLHPSCNKYHTFLCGCCTSCAVRIKSGEIRQPEALGISAELKAKGYALLCVGYPTSDIEVETQDEDEVYWLQFGRYFARGPIERDDYALELAMGDE